MCSLERTVIFDKKKLKKMLNTKMATMGCPWTFFKFSHTEAHYMHFLCVKRIEFGSYPIMHTTYVRFFLRSFALGCIVRSVLIRL